MVNFRDGATKRIISAIDDLAICLSLTSTTISIQPIPVPALIIFPTFLSNIRLSISFLVSISCLEAKSSPGQRITNRSRFSSCKISCSEVLAVLPWGALSEQQVRVKMAIKKRIEANLIFMALIGYGGCHCLSKAFL